MKKWKKRSSATSIKEVVEQNSGMLVEELANPLHFPRVENLQKAADVIESAIKSKEKISVVADYDADGITSASILRLMFKELGVNPTIYIPRRMSDGYGLSASIVEGLDIGLLITVDNGISANEAIQAAKDRGMTVVVLDHHLQDKDKIPNADVVCDPHVVGDNRFEDYCGAGLSYRLAVKLLGQQHSLMNKIAALAAIGTVADVVPLVGDNRNIVKRGLKAMDRGDCTRGLDVLLKAMKVDKPDAESIAFSLAPAINAPGRLHDNGGDLVYDLLTDNTSDIGVCIEKAQQLIALNQQRKILVAKAMNAFDESSVKEGEAIFYLNPEIGEGIIGIVAGKLSEQYKRPAFVFTKADDGYLKGSARSFGDIDIKSMIDQVAEFVLKYGGHVGAAGLSIADENEYVKFCDAINDIYSKIDVNKLLDEEVNYYDLDLEVEEISEAFSEMKKYAPYGEGNAKPIFRISFVPCEAKSMGDGTHLRLKDKNGNVAVGFGKFMEYKGLHNKDELSLICELNENTFMGRTSVQIQIIDFDA